MKTELIFKSQILLLAILISRHVSADKTPELLLPGRDRAPVISMDFSPDGSVLAAMIMGGGIKLWEVPSGRLTGIFPEIDSGRSVSFSPDGRFLVIPGDGIQFVDTASGNISKIDVGSEVMSIAFSASGELMASGERSGAVSLWSYSPEEADKIEPIENLSGHESPVISVTFNPAGNSLASASEHIVRIWNVLPGNMKTAIRNMFVSSISYSPDGDHLLTRMHDGTIDIWNVENEILVHSFPGKPEGGFSPRRHPQGKNDFGFDSKGHVIFSEYESNHINVGHPRDGRRLFRFYAHSEFIEVIASAPHVGLFATSSRDIVKIWSERGKLLSRVNLVPASPGEVIFIPPKGTLVTGNDPGSFMKYRPDFSRRSPCTRSLTTWDTDSGRIRWKIEDYPACLATISPNGELVAYLEEGTLMRVNDITGKENAETFRVHSKTFEKSPKGSGKSIRKRRVGPGNSITAMAFSPNSRKIAAGTFDGAIYLWSIRPDMLLTKFFHSAGCPIRSLSLAADNVAIASACLDNTVKVWRPRMENYGTPGGKPVVATDLGLKMDVKSMVFSTDSQTLALAGSGGVIVLWDLLSHSKRTIEGPGQEFNALAFSPKGSILASGDENGVIDIWDVATGDLMAELVSHEEDILSIAFSPEGDLLASSSSDWSIRLWDMRNKKLLTVSYGLGDREFLTFNPLGYFVASDRGSNAFWRIDDDIYQLDQYSLPLRKPSLIKSVLAGEAPPEPEIDLYSDTPPRLTWGRFRYMGSHVEIDLDYHGSAFLNRILVDLNGKIDNYRNVNSALSISNTIIIEPSPGLNTVKVFAIDEKGLKSRQIWRTFSFPPRAVPGIDESFIVSPPTADQFPGVARGRPPARGDTGGGPASEF